MAYQHDEKQKTEYKAIANPSYQGKESTASCIPPPFSFTSKPVSFKKENKLGTDEKQVPSENSTEHILTPAQKKHDAYQSNRTESVPYRFPVQKKNQYEQTQTVQLQKTAQLQQEEDPKLKEEAFINAAKKYLSGMDASLSASIAKAEKGVQSRYAKDEAYLKNVVLPKKYKKLPEKEQEAITLEKFISQELSNHLKTLRKGRNIPKLKSQLNRVKKLSLFYANHSFSDDSLTLGSVIRNEAGSFNTPSKEAVGYAYLNRTEGKVREPKEGAEISHYKKLTARFAGFTTDGEKLTFLTQLVGSIKAGDAVLADENRAENDPTEGATHWISPKAAVFDKKSGGNTHERTIGGKKRFVPEWARANDDPGLEKLQTGKNASLNDDFKEITAPDVDDFLFYTGVKYKK